VLAVGMSKVHTKEEFIKEEHLYQVPQMVLEIIKAAANRKK
jgi:tripeptide aminopeptidase